MLRPDQLQLARREARERFLRVGGLIREEAGVEVVEYRRSLTGRSYTGLRLIKTPEPTTRRRLYVFAHECGHVALGHKDRGDSKPRYLREYEAERWAHEALRRHGVPVPRKETVAAKMYVRHEIVKFKRRSSKPIERHVLVWTGFPRKYWRYY